MPWARAETGADQRTPIQGESTELRISLRESSGPIPALEQHLAAVDRAMSRLRETDPDLTRILELGLFAGMSTEGVADTVSLSPRQAGERWREAKQHFLWVLENQRRG